MKTLFRFTEGFMFELAITVLMRPEATILLFT